MAGGRKGGSHPSGGQRRRVTEASVLEAVVTGGRRSVMACGGPATSHDAIRLVMDLYISVVVSGTVIR